MEALHERIQSLHDESFEIFGKIRRLAQDLRPPVLDTLGLALAMQTYCAEFTRRTKLPVHFEADPSLPMLPDVYGITLYRVLQESLTNIIKHAEASQAWVDLTMEDQIISLTVQDDGKGFVEANHPSSGIGLTGLRERVTLAGGKFNISSSPARGTILLAQFPVADEQPKKEAA